MAIGTTIKIGLDSKAVQRGLAKVQMGFKRLGKGIAGMGKMMLAPFVKLMAVLAPILGIGAGISILKNASKEAADMEALATAFENLLGSPAEAKRRMDELKAFSVATPFEPGEVIKTSKLLQTLGGELLSTGEGLRMVGDAAAVSGQPLEEVGLHIGRIFGAITSGTSAGESVNRLQELGLMTGSMKLRFETLAAAQKKGTAQTLTQVQAIKLLQGVLSDTSGAMQKLSQTFSGRVSTLKGNWSALLEVLGQGLNVGLGTVVDAMNRDLPGMADKFREIGDSIGNAIKTLYGAFQQGNLGSMIWDGFKYAMARLGEELIALMKYGGQVFGQELGNAIAKTELGSYLGMTQNAGARMSLGYFREETKGALGSGDLRNQLGNQAAAANAGMQAEWLQQIGWTKDQVDQFMRDIKIIANTGKQPTFASP